MQLVSTTTILKWFDNEALQNYKQDLILSTVGRAMTEGASDFSTISKRVQEALNANVDANNGTNFHSYAEAIAKGDKDSFDISSANSTVLSFIRAFDKWVEKYDPKAIYSEVPIYNESVGYAGTCDGITEINGNRYLIDYKTSKKAKFPWRSVKWQLAAYRGAEKMGVDTVASKVEVNGKRFYEIPDQSYEKLPPMVKVDGCLVIQISPEGVDTYDVDVTSEDYRAFANITKTYNKISQM